MSMRALCWHDTDDLRVNGVPEPEVVDPAEPPTTATSSDVVKVISQGTIATCG